MDYIFHLIYVFIKQPTMICSFLSQRFGAKKKFTLKKGCFFKKENELTAPSFRA